MRRMPTGEQIDKIDQAYSLSVTNEKDISTLDGQVADLQTQRANKTRNDRFGELYLHNSLFEQEHSNRLHYGLKDDVKFERF